MQVYKQLEDKKVDVSNVLGAVEAREVIIQAKEMYRQNFVD